MNRLMGAHEVRSSRTSNEWRDQNGLTRDEGSTNTSKIDLHTNKQSDRNSNGLPERGGCLLIMLCG